MPYHYHDKNIALILLCLFSLLFPNAFLTAQNSSDDIDENSLFGDTNSVVSESTDNFNKNNDIDINKKGVSFGGNFYSRHAYIVNRLDDITANVKNKQDADKINEAWRSYWQSNVLVSYLQSDIFFDLRLTDGFKAYSSFSVFLIPGALITNNATETTRVSFNEFFIDVNILGVTYFRIGKQFLKWGRGFFWTPTDLFNIDRKTFTDLQRTRSGIYALRLLLPIGTMFNAYAVLAPNINALNFFEEYTYAAKGEIILNKLEVALAYTKKANNLHGYSIDFSTGVLGWNLYGEGLYTSKHSLARYYLKQKGDTHLNNRSKKYQEDVWINHQLNQGAFQATLGINKSFNQNKYSIALEGYYNGEGYYDANILEKFHDDKLLINNKAVPADATLRNRIFSQTGYHPLRHSKWYGAVFLTFTELFAKTTTLLFNSTINFSDYSTLLSPVVTVSPVSDFFITLTPSIYLGAPHKEFSLSEIATSIQLDLMLAF